MRVMRAIWVVFCALLASLPELASAQLICKLIPGDTNRDNQIDDGDLLSCLFSFGGSETNCDFNGDSRVDDADLLTVLFNFGQQGAPSFSGTRRPSQGSVILPVQIQLHGYRSDGIQVPVVIEAQRVGDSVIFRQEATLFQNPDIVRIAVPAPGRYRIQVYAPNGVWLRAEADTNDAFVVNLFSGQTLSGEATIRLRVPFTNYQYTDIVLSVDGQPADWAGDIPALPHRVPEALLTVHTDEYANGTHTITVYDVYGHSRTVEVSFQNAVSEIEVDPLFEYQSSDSSIPSSCRIRATLSQPSNWEVRILSVDPDPVLIRSFSGFGSAIDVEWDGLTSSGTEAEDGVYEILFVVGNSSIQHKKKTNKSRRSEGFILRETDSSIFLRGCRRSSASRTLCE